MERLMTKREVIEHFRCSPGFFNVHVFPVLPHVLVGKVKKLYRPADVRKFEADNYNSVQLIAFEKFMRERKNKKLKGFVQVAKARVLVGAK